MESVEIEARNIEEAIEKAIKLLGVARENIEIMVLREGKSGLFGMAGAVLTKIKAIKKQ